MYKTILFSFLFFFLSGCSEEVSGKNETIILNDATSKVNDFFKSLEIYFANPSPEKSRGYIEYFSKDAIQVHSDGLHDGINNIKRTSNGYLKSIQNQIKQGYSFQAKSTVLKSKLLTSNLAFFVVKQDLSSFHNQKRLSNTEQRICTLILLKEKQWKINSITVTTITPTKDQSNSRKNPNVTSGNFNKISEQQLNSILNMKSQQLKNNNNQLGILKHNLNIVRQTDTIGSQTIHLQYQIAQLEMGNITLQHEISQIQQELLLRSSEL